MPISKVERSVNYSSSSEEICVWRRQRVENRSCCYNDAVHVIIFRYNHNLKNTATVSKAYG